VHVHLGDGSFQGSYSGRDELLPDTDYQLRVRYRDDEQEVGQYATRSFRTEPAGPEGTPGENPWIVTQPGFVVQKFASNLQLPVNIAFVPDPGPNPDDPLLYVTELYGAIKVVTRDGSVSDYATDLLNFKPTGTFPGSGEIGLTGIAVDPASGDVFASLVYQDPATSKDSATHYGEVFRFHSVDGGRTAGSATRILDLAPFPTGPSHQISNLTVGPDGKLYVHVGDGFDASQAENVNSFLGKILRVNLDGTAPGDNPMSDGAPITARDYIFARGFRNPFGGAWRASNGAHYEVENGPDQNDRLARLDLPAPPGGYDFGWDGTPSSMLTGALYSWSPTHAPVNITFVQPETFGGSGFPADQMDHAFVSESGPSWAAGPQPRGKRIVEFEPDGSGELGSIPAKTLVEYGGVGHATVVGLAAGPSGLYFTDLYKDDADRTPAERGANIWRVCFQECPPVPAHPEQSGASLPTSDVRGATQHCKRKFEGRKRAKCKKRAKKKARGL
jgi:glucose/arabinose dehydrogenase